MKIPGAKSDIYDKALMLLLLMFFLIGIWGIDYRSFIWDEMQHSAMPIFMYDFLGHYSENPGMGIDDIKSYGFDYHTHYHIFTSIVHHPPLVRLPVLLSIMAFGISEFSIRLVSLVFGLIGLLFTYKLANLITGSKRVALLSSVILAMVPQYYEFSRVAMLEIPLLAMSLIVVYLFCRYVAGRDRRTAILFGVSLGLCMLTKNYGAIIVIPLAIYAIVSKNHRLFRDRNMYLAALIAAAIAVPWYAGASVLPELLGIPYSLSGHYGSYLGLSLSSIPMLPGLLIQQFSYAIGMLTLAAFAYSLYKRDEDDFILLSLISFFYIFFAFFVPVSSANFDRFAVTVLPAFAILDAKFLARLSGHRKVKGYGNAIIAVLVIVSIALSMMHAMAVEIRYPVEDAAVWVLQNTPREGGYIYTDYSQLFYFLKNDRDLSIRVGEGRKLSAINSLLNSTYASSRHEMLGIENPQYYYLMLRYPLRDKLAGRQDLIDYIENGPCFTPERVFGEERRVVVYGVMEECR